MGRPAYFRRRQPGAANEPTGSSPFECQPRCSRTRRDSISPLTEPLTEPQALCATQQPIQPRWTTTSWSAVAEVEQMNVLRKAYYGVTLAEVVVTDASLAALGRAVVLSVEAASRPGGEAKRIADAARTLEKIRDGAVPYNFGDPDPASARAIGGDSSFTSKISGIGNLSGGVNPDQLSELTNKLVSTSLNSCGGTITNYLNWTQHFYTQPIAIGGTIKIANDFVANDQLVRYNPAGVVANLSPTSSVTGAGTLAIVMPNVALSDAQALAALMEGDQPSPLGSGNFAVVRFTPSGNAPVTVSYHIAIHGC